MNWNRPVADEVLALRFGLKFEFDLGGREQIFEARAGRLGGPLDRAGDGRLQPGLPLVAAQAAGRQGKVSGGRT